MDEEALLSWLGGKTYRRLKRHDRVHKIKERADDDNGNDDKSSAAYIPMENVSREYVKVKNSEDKKKLDKGIRESLKPRSETKDDRSTTTTAPTEFPDDAPMEKISRSVVKIKNDKERRETDRKVREALDPEAPSVQKKLKRKAADDDAEEEKQIAKDIADEEKAGKSKPPERSGGSIAPIAPQLTQLQPPGVESFKPEAQQGSTTNTLSPGDNAQQANPLSTPQSADNELQSRGDEATTRAPTARPPSLVGQLPPTETTAVPEIPGGNGDLKGIDIGEPGVSQSLPLQLDVPAGVSDSQSPSSGILSDLSAEYQRATSKPISLFGHSIDPASQAYDAADRALGTIQSFNNGLIKAPLAINSMARYLYKPLDMALGTDYVGKHAAGDAVMDQFVDRLNITKEPTNVMERAASALGMIAMPLPGGPATQSAGQFLKEAIIPGTFVRQGAKLGDAYKVSAPGSVVVNEGMVRLHDAVVEQQQKNPAVLNKHDELEPRVTTVPGPEAKALQQRLDMDKKSFIPKFAEANYTDVMLYTAGAALTLGLLAKGYKLAKSPVEGRTILNPTKPIIEETPKSITTAGEASRTLNQNSNYALESQAHRFNDPDLVHDISTYTRSGLSARVEAMANTGTVEVPGYNYQLSASPKALVEFHQSRPIAEQEEVSRAFHILDQVDHAKLVRERKAAVKEGEEGAVDPKAVYGTMPPEPDVQFANEVLARPENAGTVRLMKEIRQAQAKVMEASGRWDKQTADNMLDKRPNYVHNIETDDYKIVDGQTVPKTKGERYIDALRSKHDVESFLPGQDLAPAFERSAVNKPNQAMDAVLANVTSLQSSVIHAYENNVRQRFVEGLLKDPGSEKAVVQLKKGQAPPKGFSAVTYYKDGAAQRVAMEPLVAEQLKFNPHRNAQILNAVGTVRNLFQQATTGVLAPFFTATSFAMEASIGSATRARGLRLGYIDQALQASTGGRMAWPGDVLGTMAAGVGAVFKAQRADSILHNTQLLEKAFLANPTTSVAQLEAQMPGFVKKLSRGLAVGNDINAEGLIGEGRRLYSQSPKGWGMKNGALHSSENELMRNVNEFNAGHVADAFNSVLGNHAGEQWRNVFRSYMHTVSNIHDAVRVAKIDQNVGRVKDNALAYEVRRSSGDLGVRGANNTGSSYILAEDVSKGAQLASKVGSGKIVGSTLDFLRATVPYINPHIQGTTRFLEQFARQPTTTLMGAINSTTMPQLAALGLAMELGPEYVDHMLNKREDYRKNNYWYLPIPGAHPNDGLEFRIDPVLAPFGYPALELMDSIFGLRKYTADKLGRAAPNAETEGLAQALKDGLKEWIGIGYPLPMSLALSSQGIASRNMTDRAFSVQSEQASGLGEGKNPSSALSVPIQLMLETTLGALGQHAVQAMDAWAATDKKKESALGNAAKQFGFSFATKAPLVGTRLFGGSTYNESGTALAQNTRQLVDNANKIVDSVENQEKALLKLKNGNAIGQQPNMKAGYPGIAEIPPEAAAFAQAIKKSGGLSAVSSERSAISTSLSGLRAVNAGNVGRHLLVPLKEGKQIGGLGYTILNEELLKQELAKEDESTIAPKMTPVSGKVSKNQRPTPLKTELDGVPKVSNGKVQNSKTEQFYRPPTLKEVQGLKNALNERRYQLDLQQASMLEQVEKDTGLKISDVASKIKLSPGQDTAE